MKLKELQSITKINNQTQRLNIAVLSNITFEPYLRWLLNKTFIDDGLSTNLITVDYNEFLVDNTAIKKNHIDIIVVILNFFDNYADISCKPVLSEIESDAILKKEYFKIQQLYHHIREQSQASVIWFGYEDYCLNSSIPLGNVPLIGNLVEKINLQLSTYEQTEIEFIDTKRLIANIGISNAYDDKNKYRWNSPYSQAMIEQICNEIHKQYLITLGITKKCIVIDCDNVLWGGILSEDGIENVHLGSSGLGHSYQDFQRYLLFLYNHGVILTVCSKNDMSDVMRMFREHSEMILKEEHISCFQVNWNNKADNIMKIADMLNIGLDSMVFVDDSCFEIESIKQLLPEVTAIKYKRDTIYSHLSCFNLKSDVDIENMRQRNNTYKTNEQRVKLKDNSKSFEEYLNALDMKINIHSVLPVEYARIAELTQRTNKCTNGKRYTVAEIRELVSLASSNLYSISVSDRFSDLGIVGAFEISGNILMLFSLSCRALGREVEKNMMKFIADKYEILNIEFRSTGKNEAIKSLLSAAFSNATIINCENH